MNATAMGRAQRIRPVVARVLVAGGAVAWAIAGLMAVAQFVFGLPVDRAIRQDFGAAAADLWVLAFCIRGS